MAKQEIFYGSVDQTLYFHFRKKSDGTPLALAFDSVNLQCFYQRDKLAPVEIPLITQTVTGAHADGGFVAVGTGETDGLHALDVPDAISAIGSAGVRVYFSEATTDALDLSVEPAEIQLINFEKSVSVSDDRLPHLDEIESPAIVAAATVTAMEDTGTKLSAVNLTTDKLDTALESDGATGYQYTETALENAPSSTGGDATLANQTTILANLAVVDGVVDEVLLDTNELQTNQGDWTTAIGFNTVEPDNQGIVDIEAKVDLLQIDSTQSLVDTGTTIPTLINAIPTDGNIVSVAGSAVASVDDFKATGFNTVVPDAAGTAAALHVTTDDKVDTMQIDVTMLRGMTAGSWAFINNQWIFYNEAGTEINRYNMTKEGTLNTESPDARTLV